MDAGSSPEVVSLPATSMSALGLDRRKMEEERLARLKKRKKESGSDVQAREEVLPPTQRRKLLNVQPADEPTASQPGLPTPPTDLKSNVHNDEGSLRTTSVSPTVRLPYPKGIVLRTWARGSPRGDDITIEEVLQKDALELAVFSSYQWDEEWLMAKLNLTKTKVLLIAYAADEATKAAMRDNVPATVIRFCFPPMEHGASCMHSKLQLLKYPNYIRIVVPTGNLVAYDWGETGVMENMVFLIDLPRIENQAKRSTNALTPFGVELQFFLKAQGVDEKMVASLRNYDFSETSRYGFLHTIGGSHSNIGVWQRTGYCGLGRTVKALGLDSDGYIDMDYICSSIGAVNNDLLTALYNACKGTLQDTSVCIFPLVILFAKAEEAQMGRLVKDRNTGQPKLNARNWECGVLIPVSTSQGLKAKDTVSYGTNEGPQMLDLFREAVPIPVELPGAPYFDGDKAMLRPWFCQED
ncbi:hypothetical protein SLS53_006441 [Cytospora paraplurivora]|uniref:PLD phosphodiesterase domain-containing protein n=1 Tax=Cytospora paraplurivora TaxID=2898453 RepID=A0AAN9U5W3_9PEZI